MEFSIHVLFTLDLGGSLHNSKQLSDRKLAFVYKIWIIILSSQKYTDFYNFDHEERVQLFTPASVFFFFAYLAGGPITETQVTTQEVILTAYTAILWKGTVKMQRLFWLNLVTSPIT